MNKWKDESKQACRNLKSQIKNREIKQWFEEREKDLIPLLIKFNRERKKEIRKSK